MLKIDELWETTEEIPFSEEEGLGENVENDWATDAEQVNSEIEDESEASLDREQTMVDAGTQTVNSDFKIKIQTRAATQTDEFEHLFRETVVQPSTEEYFVKNEDRLWFYAGFRCGSRGGEMGEFSSPPPFFWAPFFLFSLIPQILIDSVTLLQKFTPHFKILDLRLVWQWSIVLLGRQPS